MLRTLFSAQVPQSANQAPAVAHGPQVIDPADFKFIGGGAPRGGWLEADAAAATTSTTDETVAAPRGGW